METQKDGGPLPSEGGIDVDRIEKDLAAMWSTAGVSGGEADHSGITRACALNLVVYTTPADDHEELETLLGDVNEQHPGRTVILRADRASARSGMDAYVSMRCRLTGGDGRQICGEQVTIEAHGPHVDTAATAVAPLLVPDVPVYLWWKDLPHEEDGLFRRIARLADRLLIDSASFNRPAEDLIHLKSLIARQGSQLRVSDLNWGRLTSWRSLLAGFWDVPAYRPLLDRADSLTIVYHPFVEAPGELGTTALMLAGWAASRLGWQLTGPGSHLGSGRTQWTLACGDRRVVLTLVAARTAGRSDRMISAVTFGVEKDVARFSVSLRGCASKLETEATIGSERSLGRVLAYETRSDADRLSRELAFLARDTIYEETMARTAGLLGSLGRLSS